MMGRISLRRTLGMCADVKTSAFYKQPSPLQGQDYLSAEGKENRTPWVIIGRIRSWKRRNHSGSEPNLLVLRCCFRNQCFREDVLFIYFYVTNHLKKNKHPPTTIHFALQSAVWAGLPADRSLLFHTTSAGTARLGLAGPLSRCVTHVVGLALRELSQGSGMGASSPCGPVARQLGVSYGVELGSKNKHSKRECRNDSVLKLDPETGTVLLLLHPISQVVTEPRFKGRRRRSRF